MMRHVVSWQLDTTDSAAKLEQSAAIAAELQGLVSEIPEIEALAVGSNAVSIDGNWDVVLIADFADEKALRTYIDHPAHQKVAGFIRSLVSARAVVDFLV